MIPDTADTIVAISSSANGAFRGIVRVCGPATVDCLRPWLTLTATEAWEASTPSDSYPRHLQGMIDVQAGFAQVPCRLLMWPAGRSYTRQATVEIHTLGSLPLLEAIVGQTCDHGARLAGPGEFTLRAFLAGRLDLTQAEAVLGVIDATDCDSLGTALGQLAGGVSRPLARVREQLLQALARLEAGLDFVDEDIEFIDSTEIAAAIDEAQAELDVILAGLSGRGQAGQLPRVALVGAPNAGKSSLFNAILQRSEVQGRGERALVFSQPGTTRDYLSAEIKIGSLHCELIDTAGSEWARESDCVSEAAQQHSHAVRRQADCCVLCQPSDVVVSPAPSAGMVAQVIQVLTKSDLAETVACSPQDGLSCSSLTGEGISKLCESISQLLHGSLKQAALVQPTLLRCRDSLVRTGKALGRARRLALSAGGEELVSSEIRSALYELGCVVGTVHTDDVLDRIFSQFCIGK